MLSGAIDVHFDNGEMIHLQRGDSLYFDSRIGHAYVSVSRQLARVIGVITSESNMMRMAREGEAAAATPPPAAEIAEPRLARQGRSAAGGVTAKMRAGVRRTPLAKAVSR